MCLYLATVEYPYLGAFRDDSFSEFQAPDEVGRNLPELLVADPDAALCLDGFAQFGFAPAYADELVGRRRVPLRSGRNFLTTLLHRCAAASAAGARGMASRLPLPVMAIAPADCFAEA